MITLREAKPEDAEAISALGRQVFGDTFAHTVSAATMAAYLDDTYTPDIISKELAHPHRQTILAVSPSSTIVGFMTLATDTTEPCLAPYPNAMELQRICTHPSTHGTGLAKQLAERAIEVAQEKGYRYTWLGVLPENARAVAFYKKMGYNKVGEHAFKVGYHVDMDDIMVRALQEFYASAGKGTPRADLVYATMAKAAGVSRKLLI